MTLEKEQVPIPNGPFVFTKDMKDNVDAMGHTIQPDEEFHWVILHDSNGDPRNRLKRLKVSNVDSFLDYYQYLFMHNQTPIFARNVSVLGRQLQKLQQEGVQT